MSLTVYNESFYDKWQWEKEKVNRYYEEILELRARIAILEQENTELKKKLGG